MNDPHSAAQTPITDDSAPSAERRAGPTRSGRMAGMESGAERNVLGGLLDPCGTDPVTGFFRDGSCATGPEDLGSHTVCTVMTAEFLEFQQHTGNDLVTPRPEYAFPGLRPGDRWCVVATRWLHAYRAGVAAPVVLASTNVTALEVVPLDALREHAVDVPDDPGALG